MSDYELFSYLKKDLFSPEEQICHRISNKTRNQKPMCASGQLKFYLFIKL